MRLTTQVDIEWSKSCSQSPAQTVYQYRCLFVLPHLTSLERIFSGHLLLTYSIAIASPMDNLFMLNKSHSSVKSTEHNYIHCNCIVKEVYETVYHYSIPCVQIILFL